MNRRDALVSLVAIGLLGAARTARATGRITVIANRKNPTAALDAGEIEAIFTTRRLYFDDGRRIVPFNLPARSPLRVAFDRAALHLGPDEAARYWIDRRVRGGHPPPRIAPDPETMLRVIERLEGGIGYVDRDHVRGSVKILAELETGT